VRDSAARACEAQRADCIMALKTTTEERLLGQADPATVGRMSEDLRRLLIAIEGPAVDEHPYEQCIAHPHEAP